MPEPLTPLAERPWENVQRMLDVDQALATILSAFHALPAEETPLLEAARRVLAADVVALDNVPPFRNSAMDGYAVRADDVAAATWTSPVELPITAHVAAGQREVPALAPGQAMRIMTGAPLPAGADSVVRFEETDEAGGAITVRRAKVTIFRAPARLDNVREAGEDIARGTIVARRGQTLAPPDLGLIASVGQATVPVHRRPVVAVLSTGNEVTPPGEELAPGAIRDSNAFVLGAMVRDWGAEVRMLGVARDTLADLTGRLSNANDADLIVTSGGVSLGDFDFVKDVLRSEGEVAIWQVRIKPGKPLAFGHLRSTPLLGLPGNPVAAAVSLLLFGKPAIRRMLGHQDTESRTIEVVVGEDLDNRGQRRHFVRVRLESDGGGPPVARCVGEQGAGVLSSLAAADALLVVPEEMASVAAGTRLQAIPLDWQSGLHG